MNKPLRVLHVVSELNQGGIENFIMNIYRKIDKSKIQFDFIVHHKNKGIFEDEIDSFGGKIYHFSLLDDKNIFKYKKELKNFFKKHKEYNIIHGHLASLGFIYLYQAKKAGIKYRIAHAHGTATPNSIKGFIKSITFSFFGKYANIKFACSTESGKYMFKKESDFKFIPNAIDFTRFRYNEKIRKEIRRQYGISNELVIGHVGRFTCEKNHSFIIDFFSELKKQKKDVKLLLVGDGVLRKSIFERVKNLNLDKDVIFTGNVYNVQEMYNAMDIFVLPSLFEGLPVTGIEAQVNGLPSFFSKKITKEVKISPLVSFLDINNPQIWVEKIIKTGSNNDRKNNNISNNNFDVIKLANFLEDYYLNLK